MTSEHPPKMSDLELDYQQLIMLRDFVSNKLNPMLLSRQVSYYGEVGVVHVTSRWKDGVFIIVMEAQS